MFQKKICDICGGEIGLLGNRKLEEGNMCKNCAAKLSPFFSDRRSSTLEQIREQLAYREENRDAVAAFHTTRTLGRGTKVLLDENAGKFMVTSARDLAAANPDVLRFDQVTGCTVDVRENRHEEEREVKDKEGHTRHVSYTPPRYTFSYDFYLIINVNSPYFDEITFQLNSSSIEVDAGRFYGGRMPLGSMGTNRPGMMGARPGMAQNLPGSTTAPTLEERRNNPDYAECEAMAEEIRAALTQIRTQVREEAAAAAAPKTATTCPWCGATTMPNANGCCEYCGGAMGG